MNSSEAKNLVRPNKPQVVLVKCKANPSSEFKFWVDHLCFIFSVCRACQARTDYGNENAREHYDRFVAIGSRKKGESIEACMDRLTAEIKAAPDSHKVDWD